MQLSAKELEFIEAVSSEKPVRRKARNISLNDEQYEAFQKYCAVEGLAPNKVIDALIGLFLDAEKRTKG